MKRFFSRLAGSAVLIAALCVVPSDSLGVEKRLSQALQVERQAELRGTTVQEMVDSLVKAVDFQFIPGTLDGQVNGVYAIYKFRNAPGFPLWLMMNMGGPLTVNERLFTVNRTESKIKDGVRVWLLNLGCADSVNGKFELQFIIEAATGKTMLEVTRTEEGNAPPPGEESPKNQNTFLFQGYVFPEYFIYTYKNKRQEENARKTEQLLDFLVPRLDFRAGGRTINPTLLERQFARLVYLDKHNDTWYVRIEFPETRNRFQKTSVLDFAINARDGETYIRAGLYDYLFKNWTHYRGRSVFTTSN